MLKKTVGSIVMLLGVVVFCWGLWITVMSLYYLVSQNSHYGDAAGIGLPYGIVVGGVGLIPIILGFLIYKGVLNSIQVSILTISALLIVALSGIGSKVIILEETDKICKTYNSILFYKHPIGGEIGVYEKSLTGDKYSPRKLVEKENVGLSKIRPLVENKARIIAIIGFACVFLMFAVRKRRN